MGRSVSYPSGAVAAFEDISHFENSDDFEWFVEDLKARAAELFPSLYDCDRWRAREDHILMRNAFSDFGVSEYHGLAAVWIAERCDGAYYDSPRAALSRHWLGQIRTKFLHAFGDLLFEGHMSNGEGVYRHKARAI